METTLPTLPPEIIEFVIDHLHDDPATLKTCALVARSWAPCSQEWLFYEVTLDSPERWDRLLDVLAISESSARSYIRQVMVSYSRPYQIAADKAGALFSLVQELHFMNVPMDCSLICHLPRLDALVLHWCNLIRSDTSYRPLGCRPSIRRLKVVQDVSFMDVVDWLDMFTNLDSLREFYLSLSNEDHFPRAVRFITSHQSITNMSLHFSIWIEYSDLMNHLEGLVMPNICSLDVDCGGNEEVVPFLFGLLRTIDLPNLVHISIRFASLGLPEPFEPLASPHMQNTDWRIPANLGSRLHRVEIVYHSIHEVADGDRFCELFGYANRLGVLEVRHENVDL